MYESIGHNRFRAAGDNYSFNEVFYTSWMHQMPSLNLYYSLGENSKIGMGFAYNFGGYFSETSPTNNQSNNLQIRDIRFNPKFKTNLLRKSTKNGINLIIGLNFNQRIHSEEYRYKEPNGDGSNDIIYSMNKTGWIMSSQLGLEWERHIANKLSFSLGTFYNPNYLFKPNTLSINEYSIGGINQVGFENDIELNNHNSAEENYYVMSAFYIEIGLCYQL